MAIVTITSDFGQRDHYVALLKGTLISMDPAIQIMDISHEIKPYDIVEAAYVLGNCWKVYPKGTIHVMCVNNDLNNQKDLIYFTHEDHFFIGPNNGVFSLIFEEFSRKDVYEIEFAERTVFLQGLAMVIAHIHQGKTLNELGSQVQKLIMRINLQPVINANQIRGSVIHIDRYENVILNIPKDLFVRAKRKRNFALYFKRHDPIEKISKHYSDVEIGEVLCLFNSAGYLEIAINMGKAASMLGLKMDESVQLDFYSQ